MEHMTILKKHSPMMHWLINTLFPSVANEDNRSNLLKWWGRIAVVFTAIIFCWLLKVILVSSLSPDGCPLNLFFLGVVYFVMLWPYLVVLGSALVLKLKGRSPSALLAVTPIFPIRFLPLFFIMKGFMESFT